MSLTVKEVNVWTHGLTHDEAYIYYETSEHVLKKCYCHLYTFEQNMFTIMFLKGCLTCYTFCKVWFHLKDLLISLEDHDVFGFIQMYLTIRESSRATFCILSFSTSCSLPNHIKF